MASSTPATPSTKETTNYARLCRVLVDVGTCALRDCFDLICSPTTLHTVLATNQPTLQSLRSKRIINPTQWGKLFPAIHQYLQEISTSLYSWFYWETYVVWLHHARDGILYLEPQTSAAKQTLHESNTSEIQCMVTLNKHLLMMQHLTHTGRKSETL